MELEVARVELGVAENESANVEIADVEVADMVGQKQIFENNIKII